MSLSKKRIEELRKRKDSDIDCTDVPELDKAFWNKAKVRYPESKKAVSLRLDVDILNWYKEQGKGYQSLMNSVLRSFMAVQEEYQEK
ncbi:3-oxoacyl-ACP synthase [Candidatus Marinamargulisbacteria bacterium SCGC AAA071-K20]|nr:3-oxoacyl-ACP synthase [Candidatus Marinamargulisbacteria bacterium SCGC AAA071-K20]